MRPLVRFLYAYVFRLGFLDGRPGLVFCTLLAFYDFLAWANVYERRVVEEAEGRSRRCDHGACRGRRRGPGRPRSGDLKAGAWMPMAGRVERT